MGAWGYDQRKGRAYVFYGNERASMDTDCDYIFDPAGDDYSWFGVLVSVGDVNNDGYSDVIVADKWSSGSSDSTWVSVYYGSEFGLSSTPDWTADYGHEDSSYSLSVASAGDVNGDGYSEIVVGTFYARNPQIETNKLFLYYGSVSGLSTVADWTWGFSLDEPAYPPLNMSAYPAGDINGDGFSDIIILKWLGYEFLHYGSSTGLSTTGTDLARLPGTIVATPGDINGDGYSDVIVSGLISANNHPFEETFCPPLI